MTTLTTKYNSWGSLPAIFTPSLVDRFFNEFQDECFIVKDSYPYNITQKRSKSGDVISTSITFALAGVPKDNVNVKLEDGNLIVSVEKEEKTERADVDVVYLHRGISGRSMKTKFNLYNVDVDNITSTFKDGLLEITLPTRSKTVKTIDIG